MPEQQSCDHHFVFLRSAKWHDLGAGYNTHFVRIDVFFCERCLFQKDVRHEDWTRDTPDWYRD